MSSLIMAEKFVFQLSPEDLMDFLQCEENYCGITNDIFDNHIRCFKNPEKISFVNLLNYEIEQVKFNLFVERSYKCRYKNIVDRGGVLWSKDFSHM